MSDMKCEKYDLQRFIDAQERDYATALAEIRAGRKQSHWIWYIFPQLRGLGRSSNFYLYGIENLAEAGAYLAHPVLGARLREITEVLLAIEGKTAIQILGGIDAMKVLSSMTLFDTVSPNDVFGQVLDKYYAGRKDPMTKKMLGMASENKKSIIGAIIGDIVGSRFELVECKSTEFELFNNRSQFTDDTVMTIAVADWLLGRDLVESMRDWGRRYPYSGYGGMFFNWLFSPEKQLPYNSFGNGSGMRVSPVGFYARSLDEVLDLAQKSAEVAHNHPEGTKGAQAIASSIYIARNGKSKNEILKYIEQTFGYDLHRSCNDIRPSYGFDVTCQGSCPEAIIAFLDSTDYESAIRLAVSLGGDSDTIACMTGGIAAAFYGVPNAIIEHAKKYLTDDMLEVIRKFDNVNFNGRV